MSEEKRKDEWNRTSFILAEVHNAFLMNAKDAVTPAQRNPYLMKKRKPPKAHAVDSPEFKKLWEMLKRGRRK